MDQATETAIAARDAAYALEDAIRKLARRDPSFGHDGDIARRIGDDVNDWIEARLANTPAKEQR